MTLQRFAAVLAMAFSMAGLAHAADHLDAPNLQSNGQVDINDLYAFQSPTNADNSVLIMTVNPGAGALSPTTFGTAVDYTFNIDNDGDAVADVMYTAKFAALAAGAQAVTITGPGATASAGNTGSGFGLAGGGQAFAGLFEDPFFFDLNGFNDGFNFTGDDFFAGLDVSAIVLEVPSSQLGANVGIWATTSDSGTSDQFDRIGRPAINTALIASGRKQDFNEGAPMNDPADFSAEVQAAIEGLNGGDSTHASAVAGVLLPDVLTFDTTNPSGFLNGRQLADDVIDAELTLLTNSSTPIGDGVDGNDVPFPGVFPYLAPANIPEPSGLVLAALAGMGALTLRRRQ